MISEEFKYGRKFKVYRNSFDSLTDVYNYLKSNPEVNSTVFSEQASLKEGNFYGVSLKKSIEYLKGGYKIGLDNFLRINEEIKNNMFDQSEELLRTRGLYGGVALPPLVAAGVPDCMLKYERNQDVKIANVYFNLAYASCTTESEIINRGLATIYLIQALEAKGYIVNFYALELSTCGNEIINIEIKLNSSSDLFFNVEKCYYPMKAKEFLRRILFRILESMPVENSWGWGYGQAGSCEFMKSFYKLDSNSLVIGPPREMGIEGDNIYRDTKTLIKKLKLSNEFDMERLKRLEEEYDNK